MLRWSHISHLLGHAHNSVQLLQSLFGIVRNAIDLALIDEFFLLVDVLPIDHTITEDLDSSLVIGETRVFSGDCGNHGQQILALADLDGEHATTLGKLQSHLNQLVTLFPIHGVFAEHLIEIVQDFGYSLSLVLVVDLYKLQERSLIPFYDHKVVDCKHLEDLLDVDVRKLTVV